MAAAEASLDAMIDRVALIAYLLPPPETSRPCSCLQFSFSAVAPDQVSLAQPMALLCTISSLIRQHLVELEYNIQC